MSLINFFVFFLGGQEFGCSSMNCHYVINKNFCLFFFLGGQEFGCSSMNCHYVINKSFCLFFGGAGVWLLINELSLCH